MVNIAYMKKDLKQLLKEECNFTPSDALVEEFIEAMEETQVKPRSRIIEFGKICTDVFCVKKGIVRLFHVDDAKETTFGFASPGTIFMSPLSFYLDAPAFLMAETCKVPVTLLRMSRKTFYDFINSFRLERAKSLLGDAAFGGSIEETALLSGFNSVSTFRRSFQKKYGCTPSQYRRQRGD